MALSKSENKQFSNTCLPYLVKSVATDFGFDFRVCPRQMHVSPTVGLHITAQRRADARLTYPLNVFVFWQPACVRKRADTGGDQARNGPCGHRLRRTVAG
jgi:hypothetical protein